MSAPRAGLGRRPAAPGVPARRGGAAAALALGLAAALAGGACSRNEAEAAAPPATAELETSALTETEATRQAREARIAREFPLHGLVTGLQLVVYAEPDADSTLYGWVRVGSRVRLAAQPTKTPTCNTGWHRIHPEGWVCVGQGIAVGEAPPQAEFEVAPPDREVPLPYTYWYVKEPMVPEYHRLPSRDEQRAALAVSAHYLELLAADERRAEKYLAGELPGPRAPAVVHRFLDRGFFLASTGVEVRAFRNFVRTPRGRFVKQSQLEPRTGADFVGVDLAASGTSLPVVWTVRGAEPTVKVTRADGTVRMARDETAAPIPRLTRLTGWRGRVNVDGRVYHELEGGRYLKSWFAAVAERIAPPAGIADGEPWVHVDRSEQTLVVYRGAEPVYATLVSTGVEGFDTPVGEFTIHRKYIGDTMANVGDDKDARYSIEDVPWAQYFEGAVALHGAFWHGRFGLPRSHGCVNLSPPDAHRVFDETWPRVPDGWLGVSTERTPFRGSRVVVTE